MGGMTETRIWAWEMGIFTDSLPHGQGRISDPARRDEAGGKRRVAALAIGSNNREAPVEWDGDGHTGSHRGSIKHAFLVPMGEAKCQTRHGQDKAPGGEGEPDSAG